MESGAEFGAHAPTDSAGDGMRKLAARPVDPRDQSWEDVDTVYRVYFISDDGASDEWRLEGARSVHEACDWARQNRGSRAYVLYVETSHGGGVGLIEIDRQVGG